MKFDLLSLHPEMFDGPLNRSILGRARTKGLLDIQVHNPRQFGIGKHRQVDDILYGGGSGMLMRVDVLDQAIGALRRADSTVILMDPIGTVFSHEHALRLSKKQHLIFVCGHYEGVDARVADHLVDEIFSIGDFVLTGGELACMAMVDAISRLRPGVLGNPDSLSVESFTNGLLEAEAYTRPRSYKEWAVPDVLLSGHHQKISSWRRDSGLERTKKFRPDLYHKWLDKQRENE